MRLGKLIQYEIKNQTAVLEFENGEARIEVLTPAIINVYQGKAEERVPSKAIEGVKSVPTEIHAERREDGLWIHTGEVSVRVSDGFYVDFYDKNGAETCVDYRGERKQLQRVSDEFIRLLEEEKKKIK